MASWEVWFLRKRALKSESNNNAMSTDVFKHSGIFVVIHSLFIFSNLFSARIIQPFHVRVDHGAIESSDPRAVICNEVLLRRPGDDRQGHFDGFCPRGSVEKTFPFVCSPHVVLR